MVRQVGVQALVMAWVEVRSSRAECRSFSVVYHRPRELQTAGASGGSRAKADLQGTSCQPTLNNTRVTAPYSVSLRFKSQEPPI